MPKAAHGPSCAQKEATQVRPDWSEILQEAINKPGIISSAYTAFWNYSTGNQLLAWFQCLARKIELGPIHTFSGWQRLQRHVKKGEKALTLCIPRHITKKLNETPPSDVMNISPTEGDGAERNGGLATYTIFVYRSHWFVWEWASKMPARGRAIRPHWGQ